VFLSEKHNNIAGQDRRLPRAALSEEREPFSRISEKQLQSLAKSVGAEVFIDRGAFGTDKVRVRIGNDHRGFRDFKSANDYLLSKAVENLRAEDKNASDIRYALAEEAEQAWQGKVVAPAARKLSQGVASLIGKGASGEQRLAGWEAFKKHWQEFWQPFSTLKGGDQALAARYRAMGNVAQATRFIEGLYRKLDTFPDDVKRDMFWYLDGQIPLDVLPQFFCQGSSPYLRRY